MIEYDEDRIMQDADDEPVVRDFIRMMHSISYDFKNHVTQRINETLAEKPIEDMITDQMITRIVERVFAMLDPIVREQITGMEEKLRTNIRAPREMEGEQWSKILRRLADTLDEQSQT